MDNLLTLSQLSKRLLRSRRELARLCKLGRVRGAFQIEGGQWLVPDAASLVTFNKRGRPAKK